MPAFAKIAVGLRFGGDDLDPDEITRALGAPPDLAARKGDRLPGRGVRIARVGIWQKAARDAPPGDLDGRIVALLALLTQDVAIWCGLTRRFRADIFCGLFLDGWNEGGEIAPTTLAALGLRGVTLGLDIYGAGRPHETEA